MLDIPVSPESANKDKTIEKNNKDRDTATKDSKRTDNITIFNPDTGSSGFSRQSGIGFAFNTILLDEIEEPRDT